MKQKIIQVGLIIVIFISGILIGTPLGTSASIINLIINILAILYVIITSCVNKREQVISNKIDIFVLILCISPTIPIIFKTYASLADSIEYLTKYLSCFILYLIASQMYKKDKNTSKYINIGIVITILVIILFGIDIVTTNLFNNFLENINSTIIDQGEVRLSSTFGYGNTFAVIVAFGLIININLIKSLENKIVKYLFQCISFVYMASFILSFSRIVYICFAILLIIYLLLIKEKKEVLKIVIISGIYGLIYSKIFMNILNTNNYIPIWSWLIIFAIINGTSITIINHVKIKIKNLNIKKVIFISIILVVMLFGLLIYAFNQKSDLILFNTSNTNEVVRYLYNIEYEEHFVCEFDIESYISKDSTVFEIEILEKNRYFDDIKSTIVELKTYEGKKKIDITLDKQVAQIYIYFRTNEYQEGQYLKIKDFNINGKQKIINYKYLPTNLVTKITSISFKHKSAWERLVFIKDGLKIVKGNLLTGIGGNGWIYQQGLVQSHNYQANEVHCYPLQVLIEYGIIGFGALVIIVVILIKNIYQKAVKQQLENQFEFISIFVAFSIIALHSLFDFDMTFMFVMCIMFIYLGMIRAIIVEDNINYSKVYKLEPILLIIGILPCFYFNINLCLTEQIIYPQIKDANIKFTDKIDILRKCTYNNPYNYKYKVKLIEYLEINKEIEVEHQKDIALEEIKILKDLIKNEKYNNYQRLYYQLAINELEIIDEENKEEAIEGLYLAYNGFKDCTVQYKFDQKQYLRRAKYMKEIAENIEKKSEDFEEGKLDELKDLFYSLNLNEYESSLEIMHNYEDCRVKREVAEENMKKLEELVIKE